MHCHLALILLATLAGLSTGCSESEFVPVEGQVLFKDKPLASGVIMFQPANGPPSRSDITAGAFKLTTLDGQQGARIGLNKVRIASRATPQGSDAELALGKSLIPERYAHFDSSELTAEVKPEVNEPFVFRLED